MNHIRKSGSVKKCTQKFSAFPDTAPFTEIPRSAESSRSNSVIRKCFNNFSYFPDSLLPGPPGDVLTFIDLLIYAFYHFRVPVAGAPEPSACVYWFTRLRVYAIYA